MDLTSNPNTEKLTKTKVKGRTVYVSEKDESAFVQTDEGIVSMTNLRAWNHLLEKAKIKGIDGYEEENSIEEKEMEKKEKAVAEKIQKLRRDLAEEEARFR